MIAYTLATNCYSGQSLSEKKTSVQQLSSKGLNLGTTSVDSLSNIIMHGLVYISTQAVLYLTIRVPFRLAEKLK